MRRVSYSFGRSAIALTLLSWWLFAACAEGSGPRFLPIEPQRVRVNQTLSIQLAINNPDGRSVVVRVEAPELPAFDQVTQISTHPVAATFRWSPLVSQTGTHQLTFVLTDLGGRSEYDRLSVLVEVLASEDAAPVFILGAGGRYDLGRDPCVSFDIDVRDDDSPTVAIRSRGPLPEGASLSSAGAKRAVFDWCPTPDQAAASDRWTIRLAADDGEHPPVEHDYMVVLETGPKEGCPGSPPTVSITAPRPGERITSGSSYPVEVTASDDRGLRDPPLLYYSLTPPLDMDKPDVTSFAQVSFEPSGGDRYFARIPPLGLGEGEEAEVYLVVTVTDNDDAAGSLCDHRTDSELLRFIAVGGTPPDGSLGNCEYCTGSLECASGICATTASGGRCVQACATAACTLGVCGATATREGGVRAGCGPASEICEGTSSVCRDDSREDDDVPADATLYAGPYFDGRICSGDSDYFAFDVARGERLVVTLSDAAYTIGDLDLSLQDSSGTILHTSSGVGSTEEVEYCNPSSPARFYARVFGYRENDENTYSLSSTRMTDPDMCCIDDPGEDDDTRTSARSVSFRPRGISEEATFSGQICSGDDDYVRIPMSGPGRIEVRVAFTHSAGDLDIELYDPSGVRIARSASSTNDESLTRDVAGGGTYVLRIFGFLGVSNSYEALIIRTTGANCSSTLDCPVGTVCDAGTCADDDCETGFDCPPLHTCLTRSRLSSASRICGANCSSDAECRSGEACKWAAEGRACGTSGSSPDGASCLTLSSCAGQSVCHSFLRGYCARLGCTDTMSDCEGNTACVTVDSTNLCALRCSPLGSGDCRTGYTCQLLVAHGDATPYRYVCVPSP